jgi:hypothetical protein
MQDSNQTASWRTQEKNVEPAQIYPLGRSLEMSKKPVVSQLHKTRMPTVLKVSLPGGHRVWGTRSMARHLASSQPEEEVAELQGLRLPPDVEDALPNQSSQSAVQQATPAQCMQARVHSVPK